MRRHIRIFVGSPSDVRDERQAAYEIAGRLPYEPSLRGLITTEIVAWDGPYFDVPLLANFDPQRAISHGMPRPSACDFVVIIMWRTGTALPDSYRKPAGTTYASGTEWEYLDAVTAYETAGRPEVLVYRRTPGPTVPIDSPPAVLDDVRDQYGMVERFFGELRDSNRGFNTYTTVNQFAGKLESHLKQRIAVLLHEPSGRHRRGRDLRTGTGSPPIPALKDLARDRLTEPFKRRLAVEALSDHMVPEDAEEMIALADALQRDRHAEVAKAGVQLAGRLIAEKLADVLLLLAGAGNRNWEPRAAAAAIAGRYDLKVLDVFLAVAEARTHYWRPIYTIVERMIDLRPDMTAEHVAKLLHIIDVFLDMEQVSDKTREKLRSARVLIAAPSS